MIEPCSRISWNLGAHVPQAKAMRPTTTTRKDAVAAVAYLINLMSLIVLDRSLGDIVAI